MPELDKAHMSVEQGLPARHDILGRRHKEKGPRHPGEGEELLPEKDHPHEDDQEKEGPVRTPHSRVLGDIPHARAVCPIAGRSGRTELLVLVAGTGTFAPLPLCALHLLPTLADAFGDRLHARVVRHLRFDERPVEARVRAVARRLGVPVVAGNEVLYHSPSRRTLPRRRARGSTP